MNTAPAVSSHPRANGDPTDVSTLPPKRLSLPTVPYPDTDAPPNIRPERSNQPTHSPNVTPPGPLHSRRLRQAGLGLAALLASLASLKHVLDREAPPTPKNRSTYPQPIADYQWDGYYRHAPDIGAEEK